MFYISSLRFFSQKLFVFILHELSCCYGFISLSVLLISVLEVSICAMLIYFFKSLMNSGVTCMELARQLCSPHFLRLAVNSLLKAQVISVPIPIVSIMLAQAEGSLGLKENWESGLRLEWSSWPPGLSTRL